jgi:beta-glucosidase
MTTFPQGFIWGTSVASHQVEGNNTNNDCWFAENVTPTVFKEPSGIACDSYVRWAEDVDLVKAMGLNAYRFSLEWSRIEPTEGTWDEAELAHYEAIVDRCHEQGLKPIVTMSHFTTPHWFAAKGGWLNPEAADQFARFCAFVVGRIGHKLEYIVTLNEPNLPTLLGAIGLPDFIEDLTRKTIDAASKAAGVDKYRLANVVRSDETQEIEMGMAAGHTAARNAMKAIRPELKIGVSIAIMDEQAEPGGEWARDEVCERLYGRWIRLVKDHDDFIGVQNYSRNIWLADGTKAPNDPKLPQNQMHTEVYAPSLANCVRWTHAQTNIPILVTEHGVSTTDDEVRANLITDALTDLGKAISDGVPVLGYCHWSLLDNFEWIFGYEPVFGLVSVDREHNLERTRKPSSFTYEQIARTNTVS